MKTLVAALNRRIRRPRLIVRDGLMVFGIASALFAITWRRTRKRQLSCASPGHVVVSLTSYPKRFGVLALTLESLLLQKVAPDIVVLWIAYDDFSCLPAKILKMKHRGLMINTCDDLRSYKKLIPSLQFWPESVIVTADDDTYYPPNWLSDLLSGAERHPGAIICNRAARILVNSDGSFCPYGEWDDDVQDQRSHQPSHDLMPIGVAGILYPPRSLSEQATRGDFIGLAPFGDDIWFYWMARIIGTKHVKVGACFPRRSWPRSQADSLWSRNAGTRNDLQIAAVSDVYGWPNTHDDTS